MDPTDEELANIQDIDGCCAWSGLEGPLRDALMAAIGDPQRLREVALIPRPTWDNVVATILVGQPPMQPQAPTPVEGSRIESLRRVCLLRMGKTPDSPGDVGPAIPGPLSAPFPPVGGGALANAAATPSRRLKLSSILDPTLDAEIQSLEESEVATMYERYRSKFGDFPSTETDVSKDQLSAIAQVLADAPQTNIHVVPIECFNGRMDSQGAPWPE